MAQILFFPAGGGPPPAGPDRFAPKYLVGNVPAGDSNVAYSSGGFVYFPDPGDGSGIAAALAAAGLAGGGDVHIRPGEYRLTGGQLDVPARTLVSGAGPSTRIVGKRGAFRLLAGPPGEPALSTLRDLSIVIEPTFGSPGVMLGAVQVESGGCVLNGLTINVQAVPGAQIRHGVVVNTAGSQPVPQTSIESVTISDTGITLLPNATSSAVLLIEGQVAARNLTTFGFDTGVWLTNNSIAEESGGCVFFGLQVYVLNARQYGCWAQQANGATNVAAIRLSDSVIIASGDTPPLGPGSSVGCLLEASFVSTFRSVITFLYNTGYDIRPNEAETTASVQIDDCGIFFCTLGVRFGPGSLDSSVSDTEIGAPAPSGSPSITAECGVWIDGSGALAQSPRGIAVSNNLIHATDYQLTGADSWAIRAEGASNLFIEGNEVQHFEPQQPGTSYPSIGIANVRDCTVADNTIESTSATAAIRADAACLRLTCTGNTVQTPAAWVPYAIECAAERATITGNSLEHLGSQVALGAALLSAGLDSTVVGNTIRPAANAPIPAIRITADNNAVTANSCATATAPASGIEVTGNNNTCVANVCLTVPPVNNTGLGNEVAHNI